ncbi:MAG: PhoH family protein, partial [Gammaproteobacteria bacterium]
MSAQIQSIDISLLPADNDRLADLCGQFDSHLRQLEQRLGVEINNRGNQFRVIGNTENVRSAAKVLEELYRETENGGLTPENIHLSLSGVDARQQAVTEARGTAAVLIKTPGGTIMPRGENQQHYLRNILGHDLNFGIGPAGTGKTYLAVACAVHALEQEQVSRLVLVRPAVEAGERLGFLPGDMTQKVDPYLRPL